MMQSSSSFADDVQSQASLDDSFIASALDSTGSRSLCDIGGGGGAGGGGNNSNNSRSGEEKKFQDDDGGDNYVGGMAAAPGDTDGLGSPKATTRRTADDHYNYNHPIGMTIGDWHLSPMSPSAIMMPASPSTSVFGATTAPTTTATATTYGGRNHSHSIHSSVHMHVQENAKISTYNHPVDRSNSTTTNNRRRNVRRMNNNINSNNNRYGIQTMNNQQERQQHLQVDGGTIDNNNNNNNNNHRENEFDNNSLLGESMAELFLSKESTIRRSLNLNYEFIGSLPGDLRYDDGRKRMAGGEGSGSGGGGRSYRGNNGIDVLDEDTQMEMDALTAAIDPTPWSEIEGKINADVRNSRMKQDQQQSYYPTTATAAAENATASEIPQQHHPHQSSYYPYGRHHQLPIPGKPVPPPRSHTTAASTAATTAAVGSGSGGGDNDAGLADALATAAALAAAATITGELNASSNSEPMTASTASQQLTPNTTTQPQQSTAASSLTSSSSSPPAPAISNRHTYQRYISKSMAPSHHSSAHTKKKASVIAAASKKSQYGFGGDHTVPSVPAPPQWKVGNNQRSDPSYKSGSITTTGAMRLGMRPAGPGATTAPSAGSAGVPPRIPIQIQQQPGTAASEAAEAASSILSKNVPRSAPVQTFDDSMAYTMNSSGEAYERKKQRAKDARVKLNDSIERLHIAMGLAGSQSKQRIDQLKNGSLIPTEVRQKTIQINEECARLADQAKKWDRPSFVGTAASIIQSLNAECESLLAELYSMQSIVGMKDSNHQQQSMDYEDQQNPQVHQQVAGVDATATLAAMNKQGPSQVLAMTETFSSKTHPSTFASSPTSHPEHKRHEHPVECESPESSKKRQRGHYSDASLNHAGDTMMKETEGDEAENKKKIVESVAKMLDPVMLCRCRSVSKRWSEMSCFVDNDLWLSLAIKRFGFYNVRQWNERLEDVDGVSGKVPSLRLYKEMNAANVMPHFSHEGMSLLGDAMIPGRASGWVFLVERSNGETLRSVRQPPNGVEGEGPKTGSYQSRPVVELRIIIQNIGMGNQPIVLKDQCVAVDVSTRRSGGELKEIDWDDRFKKVVRNLDGTYRRLPLDAKSKQCMLDGRGVICKLELFETAVIEVHINARGCSTTSKFQQRSNFTKLLVTLDGTTIPLVIPFLRDHHHGVH